MNGIPTFAVVGRSNKGKSSIVATLTENDQIEIAPSPRTTQECQVFTMKVEGQSLFAIVDTPGFEEAPAVLEWLKAEPVHAHQRKERVALFLRTFAGTEHFCYERKLLEPVMNGAAILYVADASHPYRPNYETEFEILQWTGQPSMALINQIGDQDHLEDWRNALNQYFRKIKVFNAHRSHFQDRIVLLEELRVIHEELRPAIDRAIEALSRQQQERLSSCASIIAGWIAEALSFQLKSRGKSQAPSESEKRQMVDSFHDCLRQMEAETRQQIVRLFNYRSLETSESVLEKPVYEKDLFSHETWDILGLSKAQLISVATAAGALAGGSLDAMVGGASFLLGTGIGAILGGASSSYFAYSDPHVAGIKLTRAYAVVGPHQNENFPWVLLDRSMSFMEAILRRTHAQQGTLQVGGTDHKLGLASRLSKQQLRGFAWQFRKIKWGIQKSQATRDLAELLKEELLRIDRKV